MNRDTQLDALEAAAASWLGTPFCEHSAVKGAGVCCHRAVAEVYVEAGLLPRLELPTAAPGWANAQGIGLMAAWLDTVGLQWFRSRPERALARAPIPGDLVGFRFGRTLHHLALALRGGRFFHAIHGHGAVLVEALPERWAQRIERVWEPKLLCH